MEKNNSKFTPFWKPCHSALQSKSLLEFAEIKSPSRLSLSPQGKRGADREKQIDREYTPFTKYYVENSETTASVVFMRSMSERSYLERIKLLIYLELKPTFF